MGFIPVVKFTDGTKQNVMGIARTSGTLKPGVIDTVGRKRFLIIIIVESSTSSKSCASLASCNSTMYHRDGNGRAYAFCSRHGNCYNYTY
jgi:hypothetical protein